MKLHLSQGNCLLLLLSHRLPSDVSCRQRFFFFSLSVCDLTKTSVQRPLQLGRVLSQHRRQLHEIALGASIPQELQRLGPGPPRPPSLS